MSSLRRSQCILIRCIHPTTRGQSIEFLVNTRLDASPLSPETILTLRALSNFEALYLSRSSTRLNESVAQGFAGGARAPPGMNEGINIARTVANELDSARFDPLLIKAVAKNVSNSLEMMLSRADGLVCFLLVRCRWSEAYRAVIGR